VDCEDKVRKAKLIKYKEACDKARKEYNKVKNEYYRSYNFIRDIIY